jgi:hypothetical protein
MYSASRNLITTVCLLYAFLTLACNLNVSPFGAGRLAGAPVDTPPEYVEPATEVPVQPSPTNTNTPTDTPIPGPTPAPGTTESPTSVPVPAKLTVPTPVVNFNDLAPHKQAMRPEFSRDIDQVVAAGASHYFIDIAFRDEAFQPGNQVTYTGTERILYTNTETVPLNNILFRLYPNLVGFGGKLSVNQVVVNNVPTPSTLQSQDTVLNVPLNLPLNPGDQLDITLFFQGTAYANPQQGYNIFSYANETLALAGFYPAVAVYDDQGWDISIPPPYGDATYLDTSLFQVKVTVPQEMAVVASGSVATETPNRNQSKTVTLVSGPIRDFYMVIDPTYQPIVDNVDGITVTSYAPADLEAGSKLALAYTVDALTVFNQKFGPYPYTEFDIVATPTTAGGVEYPGIVVIAERLYNQEGGFFQHAVGHEVAHQWWYGMVGNNQVLEPWLDEALTNYSTAIYWELAEGEDIGEQIISSYFVSPYEQARSQDRDRAVLGPVENFSQGEYGTFVYGKGPLFFHAVRETYGDDQFFEIMQLYLNTHRYQNVTAEDLWATIESVTGQSIQPLIETWLQHP